MPFSEVVAECYRRTFFDTEQAAKYGTEVFAQSKDAMNQMAQFLVSRMERGAGGAECLAPSTDTAH